MIHSGTKNTPLRQSILNTLSSTSIPMTVQDIMKSLSSSAIHPHKTSVYRGLLNLMSDGVIRQVQLSPLTQYFELADSHHHHAVCTECGAIADVDLDEKNLLASVEKLTQFNLSSHTLEFFGACPSCQ